MTEGGRKVSTYGGRSWAFDCMGGCWEDLLGYVDGGKVMGGGGD